ncbi:hypothetical protein F0562_023762 [Nyssa sinensis]|uniref:Response regulatory domain-containing protein n=1 Tax=Nyssa sinensis TaxID=561372 RepID=A0A5J5BK30_9ASTE|nr:hypothetical protein F0562_023762 [Nyssa sinensis]
MSGFSASGKVFDTIFLESKSAFICELPSAQAKNSGGIFKPDLANGENDRKLCAERSPKRVEVSDHSPSASRELHVLAVDDSHVDQKVIERLLRFSSCKVTAVESGRRALQYLGLDGDKSTVGFDALKVNLILTDYSMPGMTGYELLKKIKESSTLREIPVVIMSSENILTRIHSCFGGRGRGVSREPVKLSDVKRLKDFVLRGEGEENGVTGTHKRKLQDNSMPPSSSSSSSSLSSYQSPSPGPMSSSESLLSSDGSSSPQPSSSPLLLKSLSKRPRLRID